MKELLDKIASIRELVTASAKDNKALTDQMEEIKTAQSELAIAFDKNTNDLKEKELVIASQNERIMELESDKFVSDCKNEVARILKPNGIVIICGWNTNGIGLKRGFKMLEILAVPHGGSKNDTLCTVERKLPTLF